MIQDKLEPQTRLLVASIFSLAVGLAAGLYALWPSQNAAPMPPLPVVANKLVAIPPPPSVIDKNVCASLNPQDLGDAAAGSIYVKNYAFTGDYLTNEGRLEFWNRYLKPLGAKPINYLEVGIYEGSSMLWMLENVLRHRDSTATGIDLVIYQRYLDNLVRSGSCEKVRNLRGRSQDVLRTLPKESFDVIYIDGSHLAQDVMVDAVLAFDLLKIGGIMVFDDYEWFTNWPAEIRPKVAIDAFITAYRHQLKLVHRGYQIIVEKRAHPCNANAYRESPVGSYCYHWVTGKFVRQSDRKAVEISTGEKAIIEAIARSAPFGEIDPVLDPGLRAQPEYQGLNRRLKIFPDRP